MSSEPELNSIDTEQSKAATTPNFDSSSKLKFAKVLMFFGLITLTIGIFLEIILSGKTTAETPIDELNEFLSMVFVFVSPVLLIVSSLLLGGIQNLKSGKIFFAVGGAIGYAILYLFIFVAITLIDSNPIVGEPGEFIAIFLFSLILSFIAIRKGFAPFAWILTGGLVGLIIISMMPSANSPDINEYMRKHRRKKGTDIGLISSLIMLIITYLFFLYFNHRN